MSANDEAVTPEIFRKEKFLRASGYNFYVWAAVNALVTVPLFAALAGNPWPVWLAIVFPVGLIVAGLFLSAVNDNRVQKMVAEQTPVVVVNAGRLWGPLFLVGILLTFLFAIRGPAAYIQPLWLLIVGAGYLLWGNFTVREFRWLGWLLIIAGGVTGLRIRPHEIPFGVASREALLVWLLFMAALWIPFGAYINRKYVRLR